VTDTAGRSLVSAARAGIDRVSSFIHRPRSLHKARLWPRSSGGANVVGDLLPLVVFFVFFGVLSDRAVSAWTGTAPAAVDALANAVLIAVVWSIFAPIAMNGLAARRCIWLVVVVVAVPVLGPLMRHPGLLESDSILVEVVLSLVFAVWAAMVQHRAVAHATCLELASPFVDGRYAVIQGGASFTNQHASAPSQRLALDVVRVRILGPRLHGLVARRLGDYLIYGSTLVNPVAGTVVATRDGIDDRTGLRWPAQGNQVVAEPDGYPGWRVALCHLRYGSVRVVPGQQVPVGQPIGQVGSSGNSREPHLHLQVNDEPGRPVAIRIGRRRPLRRNDVVRGRPPEHGTGDIAGG